MNWFWRVIVVKALNWVVHNAIIRIYSSPTLVGELWRGHDIQGVTDSYLAVDIRCAGKILLLGSFQVS
jgi:hypothetical protein